LEQLAPDDRKVVNRARRLERFLTQPFFATEQFSGIKGKTVSLKDSLDGCERILRDEFKDYPESALYMIGAIDEAKGKADADRTTAKTESGSRPDANADSKKPATDSKLKARREPQAKAEAIREPKPKPEVEHAPAGAHES